LTAARSAPTSNCATNPRASRKSKLEGEQAVAAANPRHVILRTAWLYAPYGANFLCTMLRLARERPELRVVADQHGQPTYVPHLAEALLAIADALAGKQRQDIWGTYHIAAGGETTWHGFAGAIVRAGARLGAAGARDPNRRLSF
jgi:dTDP-4-dehydrorhamnose reductase